jgi:EAL domain-containing protein (putative c-di-GMP-specific phosphodiesterase class I)
MEHIRRWDRNDALFIDHLAINVSSRQFQSPDFVCETVRDLVSVGVPPERVVLEVTEGTVIDNFKETALKMEQLRDKGCDGFQGFLFSNAALEQEFFSLDRKWHET